MTFFTENLIVNDDKIQHTREVCDKMCVVQQIHCSEKPVWIFIENPATRQLVSSYKGVEVSQSDPIYYRFIGWKLVSSSIFLPLQTRNEAKNECVEASKIETILWHSKRFVLCDKKESRIFGYMESISIENPRQPSWRQEIQCVQITLGCVIKYLNTLGPPIRFFFMEMRNVGRGFIDSLW